MNLWSPAGATSSDGDVERNVASTSDGIVAMIVILLATVCMAVMFGYAVAQLHADDKERDGAAPAASGSRVAT
jgi:hypothetical protein